MNRVIAFRPDFGTGSGFGHLRRCVSLATALRKLEIECVFEIDDADGIVGALGFATGTEGHPGALVVDSYRVTDSDLQQMSRDGARVIVIDDLADRKLEVDLVINPGIGAESLRYPGARCTALGIEYALLRPDFASEPHRTYPESADRILVTMGGSDPMNLTSRSVHTLAKCGFNAIDVVVGPFFQDKERMALDAAELEGVRVHENPPDIRALMLQADLALTGGGQTTYELAATATPSVAVQIAPNQRGNVQGLSSRGALLVAATADDPAVVEKSADLVASLRLDRQRRIELGENGRRLVDGHGAARAAALIAELI